MNNSRVTNYQISFLVDKKFDNYPCVQNTLYSNNTLFLIIQVPAWETEVLNSYPIAVEHSTLQNRSSFLIVVEILTLKQSSSYDKEE